MGCTIIDQYSRERPLKPATMYTKELNAELISVLSKLYEKNAIAPPPSVYLKEILEELNINTGREKEIAVRLCERGLLSYIELQDDILVGLTGSGAEVVLYSFFCNPLDLS